MKLGQILRRLLAPALCERCGATWTPEYGTKASQAACPGCAYAPSAPRVRTAGQDSRSTAC